MKRHDVMIVNACGVLLGSRQAGWLITRQFAFASGEKKTLGLADWSGILGRQSAADQRRTQRGFHAWGCFCR